METLYKKETAENKLTGKRIKVTSSKKSDNSLRRSGARQTFIVEVLGNANSTWQGYVIRAEDKSRQSFRSALELLRLMDDAIEGEDAE